MKSFAEHRFPDDLPRLAAMHRRMALRAIPPSRRAGFRSLAGPALLAMTLCASAGPVSAQAGAALCGPIVTGGYGPFDYRSDRDKLGIVERPHFPPVVEALISGNRGSLGGDLSYTLRSFPNHHRALISVMRYGEKLKTPHPKDLQFSVECWFDRALRFRPDDTIARMLYAQFLSRNNRATEALGQLGMAQQKAGDNGFTHYNIGMLYADMKEYDKALSQAHEANRLGFTRTELRDRLTAAGKWTEPEVTAPSPDRAASAASDLQPTPAGQPAVGENDKK